MGFFVLISPWLLSVLFWAAAEALHLSGLGGSYSIDILAFMFQQLALQLEMTKALLNTI